MDRNEEWVIIQEYPNYCISTLGNVENMTTGNIMIPQLNNKGYFYVQLSKNNKTKKLQIHRLLALAFIKNPQEKDCVDHIDGNPKNNNINDLRWATRMENSRNQKLNIKNTSGVKGVYWYASKNKWHAQIQIDKIRVHLGYYDTIEEAKEARINKANEIFGDFKNACEN